MKFSELLKQARRDYESEFGSDIPGLKELVAGLLPAPLARYHSFRVLALILAALVATVLFIFVWADTGSLALALLLVLMGFWWVISSYFEHREKRRKEAVIVPIEFVTEACKNASRLKLPVDLVDVLGLELVGWYTPHNNFFARWPWVSFSIPIAATTSANLSDLQIKENVMYLLNRFAIAYCNKTHVTSLVIRNLGFSHNALEFEVVLDAGRDARDFLAETAGEIVQAGIDDPDFGTPPRANLPDDNEDILD